ncbi:MAG: GntR family transcriptional regulator [Caldilinea sp.]|nr:GntR family transcriptional regulator [Caldilinea sp.]MDW8442613.1 GntR family transcriptional regulator [Caldilineaceae bacterium]
MAASMVRPTFRSKPKVVYDMLREAIIRGEYKPGDRLVIDEVAAQLGVSPIPVREAVRQLEADGLIVFEPYTGATVTQLSPKLIFEIFALLEALEVICGRRACMTEAELEELDALVQAMDAAIDDPNAWSQLNRQFHLMICRFAQVQLIERMLEMVLDHWERLRLHYVSAVLQPRIPEAQQDHREIIAAFRRRNPEEVERLLRSHNQRALAAYIDLLTQSGHLEQQTGGCV